MGFRKDIQALRGLAVLFVVLHHAHLLPVKAGYMGVDIFFVISGFLITSIIAQQLNENRFSLAGFYSRRAWRLLPAAYAVFIVTAIVSQVILTDIEARDFYSQLLGAITFTANWVLLNQAGYFEQAAELKPLLHTWSLSIEEQYYLMLPALLLFIKKKLWVPLIGLLTLASFVYAVQSHGNSPDRAFYLIQMRLWEFGVGSLLALLSLQRVWRPPEYVGFISLALIFYVVINGEFLSISPQADLLIVCFATALLMQTNLSHYLDNIFGRCLVYIGSISYSLYLVHWPIYSFLHSAHVGAGGLWWPVRLSAFFVSLALSMLLYSQVEQRFRLKSGVTRPALSILWLLLITVILLLIAIYKQTTIVPEDYLVKGLRTSNGCNQSSFHLQAKCRSSDEPKVVIWGDSHAEHLVDGFRSNTLAGVIEATKSSCAPVPTVALRGGKFTANWSEGCIDFNESVLNYIKAQSSVELVVLGANWSYLQNAPVFEKSSSGLNSTILTREEYLNLIYRLVEEMSDAGKQVVVMSSPPSLGFDVGRCHARLKTGKYSLGGTSDCSIDAQDYRSANGGMEEFMGLIDTQSSASVYRIQDDLCDDTVCATEVDDVVLYSDQVHLSVDGSIKLFEAFNVTEKLYELTGLKIE